MSLMVEGRAKEAGEVADKRLGLSAMGKNREPALDARPGAHMPPGMRELGTKGHKATSAFAVAAARPVATPRRRQPRCPTCCRAAPPSTSRTARAERPAAGKPLIASPGGCLPRSTSKA